MPSATRIGNMHLCPKFTGKIPHIEGPVLTGKMSVLIGFMPAATVGSKCYCNGPPDSISSGSSSVLINDKPAARMADSTCHGGKIIVGCGNVLIG